MRCEFKTFTLFSLLLPALSSCQAYERAFSPPKYPSPRISDEGPWAGAYKRAADFVSSLTLPEKVNLTTGVGFYASRCLGETGSIPRLNFTGLCVQLLPINNSFAEYTSAFPAGLNVGASWERKYAYARGHALGAELRKKGTDIVLTPQISPLGRFPQGGRNWESFGSDPYLNGEMVGPSIKGIQDNNLVATTRHFIANEQERFRWNYEAGDNGFELEESISANLDDWTMHEVYLWPFANAVKAGTGSIMCSYNQINNSYGCANSYALNYLLKEELGFQGFVMSDFSAQHSGLSSAVAGLDMSMPGDAFPLSGTSYWGANLTVAVANGTLPEWRLDDMCMRIMAAYYSVGGDKKKDFFNFDTFTTEKYAPVPLTSSAEPSLVNEDVPVRGDYKRTIREVGAASTVMLKNKKGALPLTGKERHVAIIGEDAGSNPYGANGCPNQGCNNGTLAMGWGSGSVLYPYLITPEQAISNHIIIHTDGTVPTITDNWAKQQIAQLVGQVSVSIVFVNANSGEGFVTVDKNYGDRNNLTLWGNGDKLINTVASQCRNTIVVMHTVGPVLVADWHDNENVTAILWAGLPGQESGNSILDILYGAYNPSGKLPFTLGRTAEDYGAAPVRKPNNGKAAPQQDLSGLDIDYRHFDSKGIDPIYEFGFGLSYTSFKYFELRVVKLNAGPYRPAKGTTGPLLHAADRPQVHHPEDYTFPSDVPCYQGTVYPYLKSKNLTKAADDADYGQPAQEYLPAGFNDSSPDPLPPAGGLQGGNPGLWEPVLNVTARITNTGDVAGHEVAQLYVELGRDEPPRILRGFDRVRIEPGRTREICAQLLRRDVSVWDPVAQNWEMVRAFKVFVGGSSRRLPLATRVALD
ncbi:MAG: hypothetical protein M1831_006121 [Alyxoria varia]|nr:MAG: hypothetical protein M1831_006121 [Alyxoria varia]